MKKSISLLVLMFVLFTTSCAKDSKTESSSIEFEEGEIMSGTVDLKDDGFILDTTEVTGDELMTDLVRLVEGNKKCVFDLFVLDFLPCDGGGSDSPVVQVHSEEFPTFADLEQYVTSIYCGEESIRLLYGSDGNALYLDVDGVLYTDIMMRGGMGYYVNWDDYEIIIRDVRAETCDFDVITTEDYYGGIDEIITPSEVVFSFHALLENNIWKLKEMVY